MCKFDDCSGCDECQKSRVQESFKLLGFYSLDNWAEIMRLKPSNSELKKLFIEFLDKLDIIDDFKIERLVITAVFSVIGQHKYIESLRELESDRWYSRGYPSDIQLSVWEMAKQRTSERLQKHTGDPVDRCSAGRSIITDYISFEITPCLFKDLIKFDF